MGLFLCLSGCLGFPHSPHQPDAANAQAIRYSVSVQAPESPGLASELKENSQLIWLSDTPPTNREGLERRLLEDIETARKILRSNGYYEGRVLRAIDWDARPVQVRITLKPGKRYVIGETTVSYEGAQPEGRRYVDPRLGMDFMNGAPSTLDPFGLPKGAPAAARLVQDAEQRVLTMMHQQGYPQAEKAEAHYILDRSNGTLDVEYRVRTGRLVRMGDVLVRDQDPVVTSTYLNKLSTWYPGQFWNESLITSYRTVLQETGLFSSIDIKPDFAAQTRDQRTPVELSVRNAPPSTISSGMRYATDTGFGVYGSWENRNLFGGGEQLRVEAPISEVSQALTATFRKPAFGIRDQALVGEAQAINENSDAYDQSALYVAGGLERRFRGEWRHWWASARVSLEAGRLDDNLRLESSKQNYSLIGLPLAIRRDTTNDLLNPSEGTRLTLSLTPYFGTYHGALSTVRTRLDGSAYWTPFTSNKLILAGRAAAGTLPLGSVSDIPPSLRFYTGGGSSVRGYKYQSIGPKDTEGDPIGGLSFSEINLEARFRITEHFGIVPFLDGGMVYDSSLPKLGQDFAWGAGLGFRYYTVIGPVRLDIATPVNHRNGNKPFQIYLSIGQAF